MMSNQHDGQIRSTRLTRRTFLRGAAGLGVTSLALSMPGQAGARWIPKLQPIQPVTAYSAGVVTDWYRLLLHLVQTTPGFSPPVASRALGYLGVTLYEALQPGMPGSQSLAGQLNDLPPLPPPHDHAYHWPTVANSALAASIRRLFPTTSQENQDAVTNREFLTLKRVASGLPPGLIVRSVQRGKQAAVHIFDWSTSDGGHAGYLSNFPDDYTPPTGPGLWIPTPPGFQRAMQPSWGNNRPFLLNSGADYDPGPPPNYSTDPNSQFHQEALEVYEAVNNLTEEQRQIALFWADDPGQTPTPPGHSLSILTRVLEDRNADLATTAEAYAKAGMAVADAFISCWWTKYRYNLIRPISYIQEIDPDWGTVDPLLPVTTPPFPEYTSGHSVQTAAFAQVLFDLFGDFPFTDHTHDARGLPSRSFASCFEMAKEAAISRLYGGIHFRAAIDLGVEQGKAIGKQVSALQFGLG